MLYEHRKHDGSLPIIGVNTFLDPDGGEGVDKPMELARSTDAEKNAQVEAVENYRQFNSHKSNELLTELARSARDRENTFAALMEVAKTSSLGEMSNVLYGVGGEYRRNM